MAYLYGKNSGVITMESKKYLFIKIGMVAFLAVYLFLIYTSDSAKDVPMEEITASIESEETVTALKKRGRTDLKRYYQLSEDSLEGYLFYKAVSPMSVEELLIIKAPDKHQANIACDNARSHLDSQKQVFQGYGTDQMASLNEAAVESKGNYVIYACGPNAQKWHEIFLSLI